MTWSWLAKMKRAEIEGLLPSIFQRTAGPDTPLRALLEVMERLHEPSEKVLRTIDASFDPRRTSDPFVSLLARWVDLESIFDEPPLGWAAQAASPLSTGLGRLRELTAAAAYLAKWRGTCYGLLLFLETATGERDFEIDESVKDAQGRPRLFHILIRVPATLLPHKALITRIVENEKPAFVTYELEFKKLPGGRK